ncbi:MAG TPA: hypothetical protein VN004_14145 [Pseudorhodoplanes sp.]|nr:hypothetical protein [Pseudorhodoplanes sp.]
MALSVALVFVVGVASAHAQTPRSGFFVGGGVGAGFAKFGSQSVYNKGISDTYSNGALIASGTADGPPVDAGFGTDSAATFGAQFGYFDHVGNSDWLWGAKFTYNYLGLKSGTPNLIIPQYGTSSAPGVPTFTGYSVTQSYSVEVNHQMTSLLYLGKSFGQGFVYAGAGVSLSRFKVDLDGVVGYATLNGVFTNVSGAPQSFSSTDWRFGAAITAGVTYYLTPSWFVDLSYLVTIPDTRTAWFTSGFYNPGTPDTFKGTLIGSATSNVDTTQTIMVSLNRMFWATPGRE